jgi:GntR family transcriptional regulator
MEEKNQRKAVKKALYQDVLGFLQEDINSGRYSPGEKLPSEDHLAREFSVSRITLREALRVLEDEGVIVRRHGAGTFVRDKKAVPIQNLSSIVSISTIFKRAGLEDRFNKAESRKMAATQRIAEKLHIPSGQEVWEVERLRTLGENPAIYGFDYFPAAFIPPGGEKSLDDYKHSLYHFLSEVCGQTSDDGVCRFKPIMSDKKLSDILKIRHNSPLMYVETVDFDSNKQPILYSYSYYVPEMFLFEAHRRLDASGI